MKSPGKGRIHLRYRMYLCLRSRGWSRGRAISYAVRNPKSFEALTEAIAIQDALREMEANEDDVCAFAGHEWEDAGGGMLICAVCTAEKWESL